MASKRLKKKRAKQNQAYAKELARINRQRKRMEKRGYIFDKPAPQKKEAPTQKDVNALKKITTEQLYKQAEYVSQETGEIISGIAGRRQERLTAGKKAAQTRKQKARQAEEPQGLPFESEIVISNFKGYYRDMFPNSAGPVFSAWVDELVRKYDQESVSEMLQKAWDAGIRIDRKVAYGKTLLMSHLSQMLTYLPDMPQGRRDDFMESFEQEEDWDEPV